MAANVMKNFGGMIPAIDDRLLPDGSAAFARNCWLYAGTLAGLPAGVPIHNCGGAGVAKVLRLPNNYVDAAHIEDSVWVEFTNPDTDVIRSPVVGDTSDRYYWASSSSAPRYNPRARLVAGDPAFLLGVPTPATAPTVTFSGGSSTTNVTRAYVYTWVSAYGEEGPPSPATVVTSKVDASFTVVVAAAATNDTNATDRNLTKTRVYRTITSSAGVATFFFVAEIPIATLSYIDTQTEAVVAAQNQLQSTNWSAPPADLAGWVLMPNGIIAGWRKQELWFCEPYRPHAWPAMYSVAVEFPIVGLGVHSQNLVVLTQGFPSVVSGVNPASMTVSKLASLDPCLSRAGIVARQDGVVYPSPNGLVLISQGAATNLTSALISKDKWQKLAQLPTLRAATFNNAYFAYGAVRPGVFNTSAFNTSAFMQSDFTGSHNGMLIDTANERVAFGNLSSEHPMVNVFNDAFSGELLYIQDDVVYWIDISGAPAGVLPYLWRSKEFQTASDKNLGAMKVFFKIPLTTPNQNPVRNVDPVQVLASDQYGVVRVYADGALWMTRELRASGELWKIPSGKTADYWQVEVEARVEVTSIQWGTSAKELAKV
jgi:hypothetical protein